jgi:hypothetical protein
VATSDRAALRFRPEKHAAIIGSDNVIPRPLRVSPHVIGSPDIRYLDLFVEPVHYLALHLSFSFFQDATFGVTG